MRQLRSTDNYPSEPGGYSRSARLLGVNDIEEEQDFSRRYDPDVFNRTYGNLGEQALPTCPIMLGFLVSLFSLYLLGQSAKGGGFGPAVWSCGDSDSPAHPNTTEVAQDYLVVEWEEDEGGDGSAAPSAKDDDAEARKKEAQSLVHIISWATLLFIVPTWSYLIMWLMDRCCNGRTCKEECCEYVIGGITCIACPALIVYEVLLVMMATKVMGGAGEHCEMEGGARACLIACLPSAQVDRFACSAADPRALSPRRHAAPSRCGEVLRGLHVNRPAVRPLRASISRIWRPSSPSLTPAARPCPNPHARGCAFGGVRTFFGTVCLVRFVDNGGKCYDNNANW